MYYFSQFVDTGGFSWHIVVGNKETHFVKGKPRVIGGHKATGPQEYRLYVCQDVRFKYA